MAEQLLVVPWASTPSTLGSAVTTFLLVRHGSHDLLDKVLAGWMPGVHLNALGRAQGEHLAERLASVPLLAVYSSPLARAKETAMPIALRHGLPLRIRGACGELRLGDWTGRTFDELDRDPLWREWIARRSGVRPPGGEGMAEVQARIVCELEALRDRHPEGTITLVSHGDVIKAAVAFVLGTSLDHLHRFDLEPGSISAIAVTSQGACVTGLNDVAGLPRSLSAADPREAAA